MTRLSRWGRLTVRVAVVFGPIALLGVWSAAQNTAQKPQTSAQKFKNIKVLKDLPADKLIPTMHAYNTALGVKCDFCHVVKADHTGFEKDDKPMKEAARTMIRMTQDLNKRVTLVNNRVTCYMCHRGKAEPERLPPTSEGQPSGERPRK